MKIQLISTMGRRITAMLITMSRGRAFLIDGRAMAPMVTHVLRGVVRPRLGGCVTMC